MAQSPAALLVALISGSIHLTDQNRNMAVDRATGSVQTTAATFARSPVFTSAKSCRLPGRYFIRRGCSFATAEELSQDTLLTVWRKASLYRCERGTVSAWIFVMARNLRIDQLRRECPWFEVDPQSADAIPSDDLGADEQIIQQQQIALLAGAIGQLTFNQRQVVSLSSDQGLSHSQISQHLSLPLGTVKSRTRLGHAKLRAALDHLRPD
jgi:RNA polymerase sigma-70 factor, ECF subfamily